ncbi:MAG: ABC-F family ATP-binding cassette domain-containing protein [Bacteroidota bacterium]
MNLLSVENLSKSFGEKDLFQKINFGISMGDKVAFIAPNGSGKSTLLSILKGSIIPDEGKVTFRKDSSIGILNQDPEMDGKTLVVNYLFDEGIKAVALIKEYELLLEEIEEKGINTKLENEIVRLSNEIEAENAWQIEQKIKQIISKLNIGNLHQEIKTLSGGQKKRLALAKLLISEPNFLILDEPTNHLDQEMVEWLEQYLSRESFTILMVTHDRYFLDNVCTSIIELDNGQLYNYEGNFEYFLEKKAARELADKSETEKAKNIYRRELEWIRKMPKARGTKSKSRIDAFENLKEKVSVKKSQDEIELSVKMNRIGGKVIELKKLNKSFGEKLILKGFDYTFKTGEKIGIVGKNGAGKSTLLNMIMGIEQPDSGKVNIGETIVFGYYSQQGLLNCDEKRVIEVVKDIADVIPLANGTKVSASQMLTMFRFDANQQYSLVSKLSGGEKRRLFLLTILMKNPNFLILDEPTNDLDLMTLATLEDFLQNFGGCLLVVSHDRYFLDKMVDHLFVFEGQGIIKDFNGTYREYKIWKEQQKENNQETKATASDSQNEIPKNEIPKKKNKISFKEKFELQTLEKEIEALEKEKEALTNNLSIENVDHSKLIEWSTRIQNIEENLEQKTFRWMELSELEN